MGDREYDGVTDLNCIKDCAPQDSWDNSMLHHCVCNYTVEGLQHDGLLSLSSPPPTWPPCCMPKTYFPRWHFFLALQDFAKCRLHADLSSRSALRGCYTPACCAISNGVLFWRSFADNHLTLHDWRGNQVSELYSINESSCLSSQKPPWMQLS